MSTASQTDNEVGQGDAAGASSAPGAEAVAAPNLLNPPPPPGPPLVTFSLPVEPVRYQKHESMLHPKHHVTQIESKREKKYQQFIMMNALKGLVTSGLLIAHPGWSVHWGHLYSFMVGNWPALNMAYMTTGRFVDTRFARMPKNKIISANKAMKTLKEMTGNVDIAVHQSTGSETYIFGLMFTENWEVGGVDQHINRVPGKFQHTLETLFDFPPGKQEHFEVKSTCAGKQRRGKSAEIPENVYGKGLFTLESVRTTGDVGIYAAGMTIRGDYPAKSKRRAYCNQKRNDYEVECANGSVFQGLDARPACDDAKIGPITNFYMLNSSGKLIISSRHERHMDAGRSTTGSIKTMAQNVVTVDMNGMFYIIDPDVYQEKMYDPDCKGYVDEEKSFKRLYLTGIEYAPDAKCKLIKHRVEKEVPGAPTSLSYVVQCTGEEPIDECNILCYANDVSRIVEAVGEPYKPDYALQSPHDGDDVWLQKWESKRSTRKSNRLSFVPCAVEYVVEGGKFKDVTEEGVTKEVTQDLLVRHVVPLMAAGLFHEMSSGTSLYSATETAAGTQLGVDYGKVYWENWEQQARTTNGDPVYRASGGVSNPGRRGKARPSLLKVPEAPYVMGTWGEGKDDDKMWRQPEGRKPGTTRFTLSQLHETQALKENTWVFVEDPES